MKTALACVLLVILFLGRQCSSSEIEVRQDLNVETTTESLYERIYRNDSGICGAWYRNNNVAEAIYNCTLDLSPPIVKQTWEEIRTRLKVSRPNFVSLMCNLTVVMPDDFGLVQPNEEGNYNQNSDSENSSEASLTDEKLQKKVLEAGENCTATLTGWTTKAPTTLSPPMME